MNTNETSTSVEQVPAWKREGLPNTPMQLVGNKVKWIPVDDLLRDGTGKIILAPRHTNVETLVFEHLGKTVETINFLKDAPKGNMIINYDAMRDTVAFRYAGIGRMSLLDRSAVAAFAWLSREYLPPMKIRERIVFPTALDDLPRELQSPRLKTQMWKAFTEDKAIQVAGVLESMWPDISATVFEDGDGWFVAVDADEREIEDVSTMEQIETVLWMLTDFDAVPNECGLDNLESSMSEDEMTAAREHLDAKAVRAFNAYAAQERIESALGKNPLPDWPECRHGRGNAFHGHDAHEGPGAGSTDTVFRQEVLSEEVGIIINIRPRLRPGVLGIQSGPKVIFTA